MVILNWSHPQSAWPRCASFPTYSPQTLNILTRTKNKKQTTISLWTLDSRLPCSFRAPALEPTRLYSSFLVLSTKLSPTSHNQSSRIPTTHSSFLITTRQEKITWSVEMNTSKDAAESFLESLDFLTPKMWAIRKSSPIIYTEVTNPTFYN